MPKVTQQVSARASVRARGFWLLAQDSKCTAESDEHISGELLFCFEGMLASPVHVYSLDSAQFQDKAVLRRREAGLNDLLLGETQSVRDVCGRASWRVLRCWQGLMGFWDSQSTFQIRKRDLTEIFL